MISCAVWNIKTSFQVTFSDCSHTTNILVNGNIILNIARLKKIFVSVLEIKKNLKKNALTL
jgi:hypothetical protein